MLKIKKAHYIIVTLQLDPFKVIIPFVILRKGSGCEGIGL